MCDASLTNKYYSKTTTIKRPQKGTGQNLWPGGGGGQRNLGGVHGFFDS